MGQSSLELIAGVPSIGVLPGGAFYEAVGGRTRRTDDSELLHRGWGCVRENGAYKLQSSGLKIASDVKCLCAVFSFSTVTEHGACTNVLAVE